MLLYKPIPFLREFIREVINHRSGVSSCDTDLPHWNQLVEGTSDKNNSLASTDWGSEGVAVGEVSFQEPYLVIKLELSFEALDSQRETSS